MASAAAGSEVIRRSFSELKYRQFRLVCQIESERPPRDCGCYLGAGEVHIYLPPHDDPKDYQRMIGRQIPSLYQILEKGLPKGTTLFPRPMISSSIF